MTNDIESSYQAAINTGKINGAIICATDTNGKFTYNQTFGTRTLLSGEKRPQQLNDIIYLASATKILTSIAALRCVDEGLLTLTGDLSSIAPDLTNKQVLTGFSEDGETPILEPAVYPITLEQLLTHSSGLKYHFMDPLIAQWREKFSKPKEGDLKRTVEELFCYPLSFQPGRGWMYGPGLDWAGRIVERVSGLSLGEYMQRRLFDPLGIDDAQFYPVVREELRERLVDLNPEDPDALGRAVFGGGGDMNLLGQGHFGGHGLFMSAMSFGKILHSILLNDGKILKTETVEEMFRNRLGSEATMSLRTALASPLGAFFRVGVDVETTCGYSLGGLLTMEDVEGWYGENTMTWGGGRTVAWFVDRKNGLCGIGAPQATLPLDGDAAESLKQTFRRDVYRKHAAWKEQHPDGTL